MNTTDQTHLFLVEPFEESVTDGLKPEYALNLKKASVFYRGQWLE